MTNKIIRVERGSDKVESQSELQRGWVRVELEMPIHKGYPRSLVIRSHDKRIEVGAF